MNYKLYLNAYLKPEKFYETVEPCDMSEYIFRLINILRKSNIKLYCVSGMRFSFHLKAKEYFVHKYYGNDIEVISTRNQELKIDATKIISKINNCKVVVELKASEFKPEYIGQLGFYVTAVNEKIKKECDAPTIGLLLCRGKNRVTVDWSLKSTNVPIGVSTYELKEQIPKELIDKLPTEEEINLYLDIDETSK